MGAVPSYSDLRASYKIELPKETEVALYRSMLRARYIEESLAELYKQQEMRTPTHFAMGQEAVAVGVCSALTKEDPVYSHHRCHLHYFAKGGDVTRMVAELYGRESGCSRGRGGSVHLTDRAVGFVGSSPILGQSVALATGSALAFRMDKARRVATAFFGEATCEEGVVYESLNYASVRRLPVLYICENNFYSTESPLQMRQPEGTQLCERVRSFKIPAEKIDGNDVVAVLTTARKAVESIRAGNGPYFIECETYRWREHVGPMFDHELNRTYRTKEEVEFWMARCTVKRQGQRLLDKGFAKQSDLDGWLEEIRVEFTKVLETARSAKWPEVSSLFDNVY